MADSDRRDGQGRRFRTASFQCRVAGACKPLNALELDCTTRLAFPCSAPHLPPTPTPPDDRKPPSHGFEREHGRAHVSDQVGGGSTASRYCRHDISIFCVCQWENWWRDEGGGEEVGAARPNAGELDDTANDLRKGTYIFPHIQLTYAVRGGSAAHNA